MKVLFVSTRSPLPLIGGHPLRTFHTLREVAKRHEVTFVTFVKHEEEWDHLPKLRELCAEVIAVRAPVEQSRLRLVASLAQSAVTAKPFVGVKYDVPSMRKTVQALLDRGCDLLHLDMLPLAGYAQLAGGRPVVLVEHNVEHQLVQRRAKLETGLQRLFWERQGAWLRDFEREAVRGATRTIAMSELDAAQLRLLATGAVVRTVPNGVDLETHTPPEAPRDPKNVLFVGAFTHFPNLDGIVWFCNEVWPKVRARSPDAELTIVGAHPPPSLQSIANLPGVKLVGQVPAVKPYLDRAAVCIAPLRAGGGTRLKLLEAMAAGSAIVSTSIGCEGLGAHSGRELVIADEADAFASSVSTLLASAEQREHLGRHARAHVVEGFGWDRVGALQEEVYREAVASAAPPTRLRKAQ